MAKTALVQARMEPELKDKAEAILAEIGLPASTALTMFYNAIVRENGFPISLKIPNDHLLEIMSDAEQGKTDYRDFSSVDQMLKS